MKWFEQISEEDVNIKYINYFKLFYYFLLILFEENGIFCIQSWYLGNVFAECVHFLFSRMRKYCRELFCLRSMLAAKIFVIQTWNYILKCVNSSVLKTKHTCRFGESGIGRSSGGWGFPKPTSLRSVSSGNFQPPSVRPIPDSPSLQICSL
jgi:hypothetical protein